MEKVIVVIGPTSVGKTKMGVALAKSSMEKLLVETLCKFINRWI